MDNTGDRKSVRAKEKQSKIDAAQRDAVTRNIMSTTEGRRWLWDLLSDCRVFASTFTGDALQSAFAEGQRTIGLGILASIMLACPDQYIQAMREANVRSATNERRTGPEPDGGDSGPVDIDPADDPELRPERKPIDDGFDLVDDSDRAAALARTQAAQQRPV